MTFDEFKTSPELAFVVHDDPKLLQRPLIPLTHFDAPLAGMNFRRAAESLLPSGATLPISGRGKDQAQSGESLELSYLVWRAIYTGLRIPVLVKKQPVTAEYLPGGYLLEQNPCGPVRARVMCISKHPAAEDIANLANFSCRAAMPLHEALAELGATEEAQDWYCTHVVKHMNLDPTANSLPTEWIKDGQLLLYQELRLVQPEIVICLGTEAVHAVLGPGPNVSNMVGRIVTKTIQVPGYVGDLRDRANFVPHEIKVVAISNPAAVSRKPEGYPEFLEQLRFILDVIHGRKTTNFEADLDHRVLQTIPQLRRAVDRILRETPQPIVAWDAEWEGRNWNDRGAFLCTVQFSHKPKSAYLLDLVDTTGRWHFKGSREAVRDELLRLVDAPGSRHGGHWFKADIPWIRHFLGLDLGYAYEPPHEREIRVETDPATGRKIRHVTEPWMLTRTKGGFDTGYLIHSVMEDLGSFKLEDLGARFVRTPMYNLTLQAWKAAYCKSRGMKLKELEGYGKMPRRILFPYALYDADTTRRLFEKFNEGQDGKPGLVDCDSRGLCSRKPFWIAQQSARVFQEMEETGLGADPNRVEELIDIFRRTRDDLLLALQDRIGWADFNPRSTAQVTELLFGEQYHGMRDKATGEIRRLRPPLTPSFGLTPIKATGKGGRTWDKIVESGETHMHRPASDKETMGILMHTCGNPEAATVIRMLRDIKFTGQVLQTVLRPGTLITSEVDEEVAEAATAGADEQGTYVPAALISEAGFSYDGGYMHYRQDDGRVRSRFYPVETGRCSSSAPNLQNQSKRREGDYERIQGVWSKDKKTGVVTPKGDYIGILGEPRYLAPIRSIVREDAGHVLLEFDIKSAEVAVLAWLAGDVAMMEDVRRAMLPEAHPDYIDIHSKTAVEAFRLDCPPTKKGLESIGKLPIRVAAKNVRFGVPYGRSPAAISRQCLEEGTVVSVADCEGLVSGYHQMYPEASLYLATCEARPIDPGWMMNPFGRIRRFPYSDDRKVLGDMGRAAKNYCIQSTVADWVMQLMWKIVEYRRRHGGPGREFKVALQIHDALALRIPVASVPWVWNEVIPACTRSIPIVPHTLDGVPIPGTGPYFFGVDKELYVHWGVKLKDPELEALGIDPQSLLSDEEIETGVRRKIPEVLPMTPLTARNIRAVV